MSIDIPRLINDLQQSNKHLKSVMRYLKQIAKLDQQRVQNLYKLKATLVNINVLLPRLVPGSQLHETLQEWTTVYQQTLLDAEEQMTVQFTHELEQALDQDGLTLSGSYPDLQAGLFTISPNFPRATVTLWYGPKLQVLDKKCPLAAEDVTRRIQTCLQQIGSRLDEGTLLHKLQTAYLRVVNDEVGKDARLGDVLFEMAHLLQSQKYRQDPMREHYTSYTRADFSYDLFRLQQACQQPVLVVATLAFTKRKYDFLWVPDDEHGEGTTYSHLSFKETVS